MPRHDPHVRMLHTRDHARRAVNTASGRTRDELDTDEMLALALTHLVELVGEAASQVPPEIREQYPQIPWAQAISMRHRLIHGYDEVDHDILWDTITANLPDLLGLLDSVFDTRR